MIFNIHNGITDFKYNYGYTIINLRYAIIVIFIQAFINTVLSAAVFIDNALVTWMLYLLLFS